MRPTPMQVSSVQAAADAAKQAAEQGRSVMVYKITFSWGSGGYAAAESEVIQAIEAQGWRLEHFVKDGGVVTVFRRYPGT
jgi:hypothetical protein